MTARPGATRRSLRLAALTGMAALLIATCSPGAASTASVASEPTAAESGAAPAAASRVAAGDLILATTTSTQDSGLLDVLVPAFEDATGYSVKTVAVGSGQAIKMGEEGNADILVVHSPAAEQELVEAGYGVDRRLLMHNSFLVVGPGGDPAGIRGMTSTPDALAKVAGATSTFVSRGDGSGTETKELGFWTKAGITPDPAWYLQSGQGMAATLRIASEKAGYTLTDDATWLAIRDQLGLEALIENDPSLLNPYHVILVNPERWPKVNAEGAAAFADFLLSTEGQRLIGEFGVDEFGERLFVPDAGKTESDLAVP